MIKFIASAADRVYQRLIEVNSVDFEAAAPGSGQLATASRKRTKPFISGGSY